MGHNIVRFRCHHSGHCCRDVVCLPTPWDVIRIVKNTGISPYKFLEFLQEGEITEVEDNDPTWLVCGEKRYIMALKRTKRGCYFLNKKTGLCTIYEHRPLLCRLYPFKLQETKNGKFKGFTLHKDVGCPRYRDGKVETKYLYKLYRQDCGNQRDYEELVKVFNKRAYSGKTPSDFIEMFIEVT
ncbi:MAG: YkgJ family cysteine cluster protein [Candidatus Hydrogenedentes bacterium]|nr:YkgJ family cysteine cluster protein [Candidatus Hydrogenedentota bacterium]